MHLFGLCYVNISQCTARKTQIEKVTSKHCRLYCVDKTFRHYKQRNTDMSWTNRRTNKIYRLSIQTIFIAECLHVGSSKAILGSIVVSISACHAENRGKIPLQGEYFPCSFVSIFFIIVCMVLCFVCFYLIL